MDIIIMHKCERIAFNIWKFTMSDNQVSAVNNVFHGANYVNGIGWQGYYLNCSQRSVINIRCDLNNSYSGHCQVCWLLGCCLHSWACQARLQLVNWHLKPFKEFFLFIGIKVPQIGFSVRTNGRFNRFPSFLGTLYALGDAVTGQEDLLLFRRTWKVCVERWWQRHTVWTVGVKFLLFVTRIFIVHSTLYNGHFYVIPLVNISGLFIQSDNTVLSACFITPRLRVWFRGQQLTMYESPGRKQPEQNEQEIWKISLEIGNERD